MRSSRNLILALILCAFWQTAAFALVPPATESELRDEADLIAVGTITTTEPIGKPSKDNCYIWQNYVSKFELRATPQSAPLKTLTISYKRIEDDADPKRPCSGGGDSYYLHAGKSYKLYLKKTKSSPADEYELFHWSGIIDIKN